MSQPGRPWKPSELQQVMLRALRRLDGQENVTARMLGQRTGQSSDGAALAVADGHDGDRYLGYQLTDAGRELAGGL